MRASYDERAFARSPKVLFNPFSIRPAMPPAVLVLAATNSLPSSKRSAFEPSILMAV